jgi:tetratricopeptide (TPR) repeat protein
MRLSIITLALILSTNLYSQSDNIFAISDGVVVVQNDILEDRRNGYMGTRSNKARRFYNKALRKSSTDVVEAIALYLKSIEADPFFVEAYDNVGRLYRVTKDYSSAIEYYQKSIALFPEGQTAHQNLALVYKSSGDDEKAASEYQTLINLFPNNPEGYYGLATVYLSSSDTKELMQLALENAVKALELYSIDPPSYIGDSYFLIGYINYFLSNESEMLKYFELAKESYLENNLPGVWQHKEEIIKRL